MRSIRLILPAILFLTLAASFVHAAPVEEVIIDDVYTTDQYKADAAEFCVFDPIMFNVDYTIKGRAGKRYKAIIIIRYKGERLRTVERHTPGSHTTTMINIADGDDIGTRDVTYRIKLKRRGVLKDFDTVTETDALTVVPECIE